MQSLKPNQAWQYNFEYSPRDGKFWGIRTHGPCCKNLISLDFIFVSEKMYFFNRYLPKIFLAINFLFFFINLSLLIVLVKRTNAIALVAI
jgi:hypothetical protein